MVQITIINPANNVETLQVLNDIIRLVSEDYYILTAWRHIAENGMMEYATQRNVLINTNKNVINIYEVRKDDNYKIACIEEKE